MPDSQKHFDVIVLGVGSMGSATCWHLAKQGFKVLGLEQFDIAHTRGSHTGQSRIIRKAYFEHPDYVPLLERAYKNWNEFEQVTQRTIFHKTGILYMGNPESEILSGTRRSASLYNIPLDAHDVGFVNQHFPVFQIPKDFDTMTEPNAGFVTPELAIRLYVEEAKKSGATIITNAKVKNWNQLAGRILVTTETDSYTCDKLVITAGSWSQQVIPDLKAKLKVTKQILAWIMPDHVEQFMTGKFPCWFVDEGTGLFYGFPILVNDETGLPRGMKIAHHHPGQLCDPDLVDGQIPDTDKRTITDFITKYLPSLSTSEIQYTHCLYTYSQDTDFIVDHLPGFNKQVVVACGFSGHGFKFVSAIGEILADLATKGETDLPIGFLSLRRFG
jgi:sarcosine oxidase